LRKKLINLLDFGFANSINQLRTPGRKKYVANAESTEREVLVPVDREVYLIGKGAVGQIWSFSSMKQGAEVELVPVYSAAEEAQQLVEQLSEKHYRLVPLMISELGTQMLNKNILFILNLEVVVRGEEAYLKEGANWMLTKEELAAHILDSHRVD
jgi:hypothetical protein